MSGRTIGAVAAIMLLFNQVPVRGADSSGLDRLKGAALSGDREAAFQLGRAYKLGDGVSASNDEAERWLEKAVRLGHPKAGGELGLILFQDGKVGQALPWLRKAAEQGDSRAQYALGTLYFSGKSLPLDLGQAKRWMRSAAKTGLPAAVEALAIMEETVADEPAQDRRGESVSITTRPGSRVGTAVSIPRNQSAPEWQVQVGAFAVASNARRYWREMRKELGRELQPSFDSDGAITRLRLAPFRSRKDAAGFCAVEHQRGYGCFELLLDSAGGKGDGTAMAVGQKYPLTP